jgi:hypothetical protein
MGEARFSIIALLLILVSSIAYVGCKDGNGGGSNDAGDQDSAVDAANSGL